ncbi:MAG: hypothetical protein COA78_19195 [Blastopirellula sp.]|nr:MAG: hypothetical protein COA78_19195 [Blastopirellula sp.]
MRRQEKQPKSKQAIALPSDLFDFMCYVHEMIETKDESATIESDDLLQCERAYAGLIEEGGVQYGFSYFPEKGIRHIWEFDLDVVDIANITEGSKTNLILWGCQDSNCRCMFSDPDDSCFHCDYVDDDA